MFIIVLYLFSGGGSTNLWWEGGYSHDFLEFLRVASLCGATSVNWRVWLWGCLTSCVPALLVGSTIVLEGVVWRETLPHH